MLKSSSSPHASTPFRSIVFWAVTISMLASQRLPAGDAWRVYFGTYTSGESKGIYLSHLDLRTGQLTSPTLTAESKNPSFLAVHPNHRYLYAVGELNTFQGQRTGAVSAFRIEADSGKLVLLNQQPSGGTGPCHVAVDESGKCVMVANYGSGSIAALPVNANGELGQPGTVIQHTGSSVNPKRQSGPHAHQIVVDPSNRRALVCDLGLDQVLVYALDPARALLSPNDPPFARVVPGAGPRHLSFHPNGRWLYVLNEMDSSITAFSYAKKSGALSDLGTCSSLPPAFALENSGAEIAVHPSGKFVYASNRGQDSIAIFKVSKTGTLILLGHEPSQGKTPRHFAIDPTGKWLLAENQNTHSVAVFKVNTRTGALTPTGQVLDLPSPVCAVFVPIR